MRRTFFYIPHEFFEIVSFNLGGFSIHIGWLLIAWMVFALGLMAWLISRQGWNRDTRSYLPIFGIIAAALAFVVPYLEIIDPAGDPVGLPIRGYGMMVMLGAVSGVGLAVYRARRMGLHQDVILSLAFWMCICGIAGARMFYVIQKWPEVKVVEDGQLNLAKTIFSAISIQSGGLVVYGSVIGGVAAAVIYLRSKKQPILAVGDVVAPAMLVGLCLGRIGCLMNGCCYGGICQPESPFHWAAISFPRDAEPYLHRNEPVEERENSPPYQRQRAVGILHGVQVGATAEGSPVVTGVNQQLLESDTVLKDYHPQEGDRIRSFGEVEQATPKNVHLLFSGLSPTFTTTEGEVRSWAIDELPERGLPVHPSQIYSSINAGLLALFLWFLYPFRRRDGQVFAVMLMVYPVARTLLELIRDDERGQFGTALTISQWLSVFVILLGVGLMWYIFRQPKEQGLTQSFVSA